MSQEAVRKATPEDPLRLAVLISGSGTGMQALLEHQSRGVSHSTVVVISNKAGVAGIHRAKTADVEALVIETEEFDDRRAHEMAIHQALQARGVEAVILSGYMRLFTPWFVDRWQGRMLNIHPSLLPDFPGAHAHRDVLAAGVALTGCSVHFVTAEMDTGKVIARRKVPVEKGDTIEKLQERVKVVEHILYPQVIDAFSEARLNQFH